MRRNFIILFASVAALVSCSKAEFEPVFTLDYPNPAPFKLYSESEIPGRKITIAELKEKYSLKPVEITEDVFIAGKVTTNDSKGNFFRSFFIQDETSGIEIKIGRYNLYNDYKEGQTVYVRCKGLTVGAYKGMVGLGFRVEDTSSSYETAYIEVESIVNSKVFRGEYGDKVEPVVIEDWNADELYYNIGKLVTLKGMRYTGRIFFMGYVDYNGNHKDYSGNCFFCDEKGSWEVPTWAMSANKYEEYFKKGVFDAATVRGTTVGELRRTVPFSKVAYSVSQYFEIGGTDVQVRTSGYSQFCDRLIDPEASVQSEILSGKTVTMTGILSTYDNSFQFTVNNLDTDFKVD